ncbi:heparan-alpha-glucosaminide N-acetyltransferase-like [Antedon mediterranea]|uniref:heparan-alpha-glucosaminide N-acetyltransferase-like n=1 Tax=Antedon mediterranea TaxID=105859 RepID=UPI003AF73489
MMNLRTICTVFLLFNAALANKKDVFGIHSITFDTADLQVISSVDSNLQVWGQTHECHNCELIMLKEIHKSSHVQLKMDTRYRTKLVVVPDHAYHLNTTNDCRFDTHFTENSNYSLFVNVNDMNNSQPIKCHLIDPKDIDLSYVPILVAIGIYVVLAILCLLSNAGIRRQLIYKICCCLGTSRLVNNDLGAPDGSLNEHSNSINPEAMAQQQRSKRLKSLDTFRGISIIVMIFVNYRGGEYYYFQHSRWNGLTVADLVFPWFIFIMGTSVALSQNVLKLKGVSPKRLFLKIVRRAVILFALGIFMNSGGRNDLSVLRIPGVLQRFSICYFVVATLELVFGRKPQGQYESLTPRWYTPLRDVIDYWIEWLVIIVLLVVYFCLTFLLPVPGCPTGYIGPGGSLQQLANETVDNCTGGAARYIDEKLFSLHHIYQHPTCMVIYKTGAFDPEGVLGSIPSIFLTFLGLQAGKIFLIYPGYKSRIKRFFVWALITGAIATILCKGTKNDGWIPVNKNLWSISFVLALSSMAFILLIACYYTIDVVRIWSGAPFFYPGMNSIFLYIGHEVFQDYFPFSWVPYVGNHTEYLAISLIGTSLWALIAFYLYKVKFFLKI